MFSRTELQEIRARAGCCICLQCACSLCVPRAFVAETTASSWDPCRCCVGSETLDGREHWFVRSAIELDDELTARYGLPIDAAAKAGGMATVARALDRGDLALAGIAAVLLQLPDPPPLEKGAPAADDWTGLAVELVASGLLKGDWDPVKHPRTGEKPNPGWFADVVRVVQEAAARLKGWPSPNSTRRCGSW